MQRDKRHQYKCEGPLWIHGTGVQNMGQEVARSGWGWAVDHEGLDALERS